VKAKTEKELEREGGIFLGGKAGRRGHYSAQRHREREKEGGGDFCKTGGKIPITLLEEGL